MAVEQTRKGREPAAWINLVTAPLVGFLISPIDRAFTIRKTQNSLTTWFPGDLHNRYNGVFQILKKMYTQEGFWHMWRGSSVLMIIKFLDLFMFKKFNKDVTKFVTQFAADQKRQFGPLSIQHALLSAPMLALLSGIPSMLLHQPMNYLLTNLYTDLGTEKSRKFKGVLDCIRKTYQQSGLLPFFRGIMATWASVFVYRSTYFFLYGLAKKHFPKQKSPGEATRMLVIKFAIAQGVTMSAGVVTYPIKVVTNRLQLQFTRGDQPKQFNTVLGGFKYILVKEGLRPLYNGCLFSMGKGIISALVLVAYDH